MIDLTEKTTLSFIIQDRNGHGLVLVNDKIINEAKKAKKYLDNNPGDSLNGVKFIRLINDNFYFITTVNDNSFGITNNLDKVTRSPATSRFDGLME